MDKHTPRDVMLEILDDYLEHMEISEIFDVAMILMKEVSDERLKALFSYIPEMRDVEA